MNLKQQIKLAVENYQGQFDVCIIQLPFDNVVRFNKSWRMLPYSVNETEINETFYMINRLLKQNHKLIVKTTNVRVECPEFKSLRTDMGAYIENFFKMPIEELNAKGLNFYADEINAIQFEKGYIFVPNDIKGEEICVFVFNGDLVGWISNASLRNFLEANHFVRQNIDNVIKLPIKDLMPMHLIWNETIGKIAKPSSTIPYVSWVLSAMVSNNFEIVSHITDSNYVHHIESINGNVSPNNQKVLFIGKELSMEMQLMYKSADIVYGYNLQEKRLNSTDVISVPSALNHTTNELSSGKEQSKGKPFSNMSIGLGKKNSLKH